MNKKQHIVSEGLKFGMLLQIGGMGPICLLLFQLSSILPLYSVLWGVWAVALADGIYTLISVLGIMKLIGQVNEFSSLYKRIVGLIISTIGISFCLMVFSNGEVDYISQYAWNPQNIFLTLLILNLLNPVAIVCYTGVFTAKVISAKLSNKDLVLYALGVLSSTPIFLSLVVVIGHYTTSFLPDFVVGILNIVVGLMLFVWGVCYIFPNGRFIKFVEKIKQKIVLRKK
ncbi:MAG: hypothetical protein E7016_05920 [Alphaproteobacteria bacterium]|nr:hypothetical protein [Alphaproteobacteria bacterium]